MKGSDFAEWLLRRVMSPTKASALVGDLLELSQTRGAFWFWRAVLASMVSGGSRSAICFAVSFAASQCVAWLWAHGGLGNQPDLDSVYTGGNLMLAPLCIVPICLLLRLGLGSSYARLSLLFAAVAGVAFVCCSQPAVRWGLPAVAVGAACFGMLRKSHQWVSAQPLMQLSAAIAIACAALCLHLLAGLLLDGVLGIVLHLPDLAFRWMWELSRPPTIDCIQALTCYFIVRRSEPFESRELA